jgi:hypothetical protein
MKHSLRIPNSQLRHYQSRYGYPADNELMSLRRSVAQQGYLTQDQLHAICLWKSKRRAALARTNSDSLIKELTSFSFSAEEEESRIGSLTLLAGVKFPTASVILHFFVDRTYPILDIRAIWSLGIDQPSQYTFQFWKDYVHICRSLASENSMSVRDFDMALWQYSREHQAG